MLCGADEECPMRVLSAVSLLSLLFTVTAAHAQSAAPSESASPKPPSAPKEVVTDVKAQTDAWFKDCKQGWDAGTHMSRRDYARTCQRMAQERGKFMHNWDKTGGDRPKSR